MPVTSHAQRLCDYIVYAEYKPNIFFTKPGLKNFLYCSLTSTFLRKLF